MESTERCGGGLGGVRGCGGLGLQWCVCDKWLTTGWAGTPWVVAGPGLDRAASSWGFATSSPRPSLVSRWLPGGRWSVGLDSGAPSLKRND